MEAVDLSQVPVVDNHCHGGTPDHAFGGRVAWRRQFTESTDPGMPREHVATTALYRRLIRTLVPFLDCDPTEAALFAARTAPDERAAAPALYRRRSRTLGPFPGCAPTEEAVFAARTAREGGDLTAKLLRAAN